MVAAAPALAGDLTSASYRLRDIHVEGLGPAWLFVGGVRRSGVSAGQPEAIGSGSASGNLRGAWPGFWPIVAGELPSVDLDGDGIANVLDDDDDGDGLPDGVESNTAIFVSASDTGTDPLDPDSDGDGFEDGSEVVAGTDPNDPSSHPLLPTPVPLFSGPGLAALAVGLAAVAYRQLRRRREDDDTIRRPDFASGLALLAVLSCALALPARAQFRSGEFSGPALSTTRGNRSPGR